MKKNFLVIIIGLFFGFVVIVKFIIIGAQEPKTLDASSESKIEEFKEKIASRVAQLNKDQINKATSGLIKEIKKDSFVFAGINGEMYTANFDEIITKIYQIKGSQMSELQFSDLAKNDFVIVLGIFSGQTITANFIYKDEQFLVLTGNITEVNKQDYSLKVLTDEKETYILDIETYTNQNMINIKTLETQKIGFSKIKEGDIIHFVIKKDLENKGNRYSAKKILIIPQEYFLIPSENK
ncbi:MAG: hypothetical protein ACPL1D_01955 [Microgenomates group bacterium]